MTLRDDPESEPAAPTEVSAAGATTQPSIGQTGTEPKPDEAVAFLEKWKPGGPWPLCAFQADDRSDKDFRTFTPATLGKLPVWIAEQTAAQRNVYFHVNTARGLAKGRAKKINVVSIDWLHVDVDPVDDRPLEAERQRIRERIMRDDDDDVLPPASVIIFSGGGYQGFWRLRDPIMVNCDEAAAEDAEQYNVQIAKLMQADDCFNADRIMRLPGTINWPNAKKRKRGQVPVVAELVRADWDVAYDIDKFVKAPPV